MIQKIQTFEIQGRGTATESKIEVQSRFTTQNRAIIYYDLRDPNGTTPAFDSRNNTWVTLPYAILYRNKIIVTGADRESVVQDSKLALDIFKRERSDISVVVSGGIKFALSERDPYESCFMYKEDKVQILFIDTEDLTTASIISTDEGLKELLNGFYYISDGTVMRYWNGKNLDPSYLEYC
jgi:hypothetical protein